MAKTRKIKPMSDAGDLELESGSMSKGKSVIGDYEIREALGQGAAGVVYRAVHRKTGEPVALKLLHARTNEDADLQRRFVREATVLEKLRHPNIVRHCECGIHSDRFFLAMELVGSRTLKDVLVENGPMPWRAAAETAVQVCQALAHAHKAGVIHRDLKPANLFLAEDGSVKVGDFGLARDLEQHRLTIEGQTVGTCRYMAPEQVQGLSELTGSLDLYALGCLMHQMLTGRPPFDGSTIVEVFEHHLFSEPPDLRTRVPDAPEGLVRVVEMLLAKDPKDRPADADAAREMLEAVLRGEPLPELAGPNSLSDHLASPAAAPATAPANRWALIGVLVVGVLVALLLLARQ